MTIWASPPIADAGDVIGAIVVILMILFGLLGKLMQAGNDQPQQPQNRPPRRVPPRVPPQQRPMNGPRPARRPAPPALAAEIDAFKREQAGAAGAAAAPVLAKVVPSEDVAGRVDQTFSQEIGSLAGAGSLSSLSHGTAFSTLASQAHTLGQLGDADAARPQESAYTVETSTVSPIAASLVEMFRSPAGAQQAIILSELIERPEHRWERSS